MYICIYIYIYTHIHIHMGMSILFPFNKPEARETFSFSKKNVIYKDSVMIFMGMKSFPGTL